MLEKIKYEWKKEKKGEKKKKVMQNKFKKGKPTKKARTKNLPNHWALKSLKTISFRTSHTY